MTNEFCQSLKEVYEIIKLSDSEVRNKIPYKFKRFIYKNMDSTYDVKIDKNKSLTEQEGISETSRSILALIYRDFLVDSNQSEELKKKELKIATEVEEKKREKFDTRELFQKINIEEAYNQDINNKNENMMLVKNEESLIKKILSKLKSLIRRK